MKQSKSGQLVVVEKRGAPALFQAPVPAIVVHDGPRTVKRFELEFFAAGIIRKFATRTRVQPTQEHPAAFSTGVSIKASGNWSISSRSTSPPG